MKIYLSAPVTGHDIREREAFFKRKAEEIRQRFPNDEIVNPLDPMPPLGNSHEWYMRRDLKMLLDCDVLMLLEQPKESAGVAAEMHTADAAGIMVALLCAPTNNGLTTQPHNISATVTVTVTVTKLPHPRL